MAEKEEKYIVFKMEDMAELILSDTRARKEFGRIVERYEAYRASKGKNRPGYIVCNQDEPYADEVWGIILEGEDVKAGIAPKDKKLPIADLLMAGVELLKAGKESLGYREVLTELYEQAGKCPDGVDPYLWARVVGLVGGE